MTAFVKAKEVETILQCSQSMAYKIIKMLNEELKEQGFITISGRISKDYLCERMGIKDRQEETEVITQWAKEKNHLS